MSRTKQLLKNTGILVVAKISTQVVNFLLLPLYTALLSTAQYGEIDIYTSLAMIIIPFLTLQVEMGIFRYFISCRDDKTRQQTISTGFAIVGAVLLFGFRFAIVHYFTFFICHKACLLYCYRFVAVWAIILPMVCLRLSHLHWLWS